MSEWVPSCTMAGWRRFISVACVVGSLCLSSLGNASPKHASDVMIFTAEWCGYCQQAKAFMKEHAIAFTELDLDKSDAHLDQFEALGGTGIPYLVVGDKHLYGFDSKDYKKVLGIK